MSTIDLPESKAPVAVAADGRALFAKIGRRLIPFLFLLYMLLSGLFGFIYRAPAAMVDHTGGCVSEGDE